MSTVREVASRSTRQLADALTDDSLLLLPVGAIEQHGDHLPVDTDTRLVTHLVRRVVEEAGDELDLWLLPPLSVGRSVEHHGTTGTLSLTTTTLLAVLDDLGASIATWPANKLLLVNGHGGNTPVLETAIRDLRLHHDLLTFLLRPMARLAVPDGLADGLDLHAGAVETSLMLAVAPETVQLDLARADGPPNTDAGHARLGGTVGVGWLMDDVSGSGVVGDPTRADADAGAAMLDAAVALLCEQLTEISAFTFEGGA